MKYDAEKGAITGNMDQVAKEGSVTLQLRYKEAQDEEEEGKEDESSWSEKPFEHPADETSFQLRMGEHDNLHEGRHYTAQLRLRIRRVFPETKSINLTWQLQARTCQPVDTLPVPG